MALNGIPFDAISSNSNHASPTERIALQFRERELEQQHERTQQLFVLGEQMRRIEEHLDLFTAVVQGLEAKESWFVVAYYVNELSFDAIASTPAPDGHIYSASTLRRMRNRIIKKVDMLILAAQGLLDIPQMSIKL